MGPDYSDYWTQLHAGVIANELGCDRDTVNQVAIRLRQHNLSRVEDVVLDRFWNHVDGANYLTDAALADMLCRARQRVQQWRAVCQEDGGVPNARPRHHRRSEVFRTARRRPTAPRRTTRSY